MHEVFGPPRLLTLPPMSGWLVMIATAVLSPNSFCAQVLEKGNEEGIVVGEINTPYLYYLILVRMQSCWFL